MNRVTFAGALFLGVITVVLPIATAEITGIRHAAMYLGGTAILIVVGVALDTMKQLETQLVMRQYRGLHQMNALAVRAARQRQGDAGRMSRVRFGIPHIATGDMLRAEVHARHPARPQAQPIMDAGAATCPTTSSSA